ELESLKIHFNSTQWSLEDRLSSIVQQESDLKLESKIFQSWLRDECGGHSTNSRSNGNSRNRKTTFHSFQKYYKKRRDQERWKQHSLRGWPCNGSIYVSSASLSKRHWYHEKLKLKDEFLPPLDSVLPTPPPSTSPSSSSSSSLCTVKTDEANDDLDGSNNWELVSLEHAFNAFPSTFQTTNAKVKSSTSSSLINMCDENISYSSISGSTNESTLNRPGKSSSTMHRKTTAGLKKKSKKIRKKNRAATTNNVQPRSSSKAVQQFASQSNANESLIIAAGSHESSEYMTLFSTEKWEKFQTFITKIIFNIERRNWEPLQSYLRFAIIDFVRFDLLINRELRTVWPIVAAIKYESEPIIEPENMPLPAKRRRRSSSKVLEYSDSNSSRKRNRLNGMINNEERFRNGSKSPSPPSCIIHNKLPTLSPVTFHMPLMTRTQSKYFFENVINGGSGPTTSAPPTTTFKDAQQIQQHLMETVISMESLQKLSIDIHHRQSVLKILKIFEEFFNFKCKSQQSLTNHHHMMNSATGSEASSSSTYRIYNGKRRRRKRSSALSAVESLMTSPHCSNRKNGKNSVQNPHHPQCHGVECSIKFDMPDISRIDVNQPSQQHDNNDVDHNMDHSEDLFDETMELLKQTEQIFINTAGNSPATFFPRHSSNGNSDSLFTAGESSSCSESKFYQSSRLWPSTGSRNYGSNMGNTNISPSKCEMKLRSRSSSSSSNSVQFGSLDESSQDREHPTTFTWEANNLSIFKNFIEINFDELESPTAIVDKSRMMIRTRGGSKRIAAAAAAAAAAATAEKESIMDE
ncbi:hypothetical protein BLA29_002483, partial [Euroglyphus maynei]